MNYPSEWTEGRYNAFITSVLRSGARKWPNKWKALEAARNGQGINAATGRKAMLYNCASCSKLFTAKGVEVDHIVPVVDPIEGFTTWDNYIARLFCSTDNLQVLCKPCHKVKTLCEKKQRSPAKKQKTGLKPATSTRSTRLKSSSSPKDSGTPSGKTSVRKPRRSFVAK